MGKFPQAWCLQCSHPSAHNMTYVHLSPVLASPPWSPFAEILLFAFGDPANMTTLPPLLALEAERR